MLRSCHSVLDSPIGEDSFPTQPCPCAGFFADSLFLTLLDWFGAYSFLLYGAVAAGGGLYSHMRVPETKGRTLAEVQALVAGKLLPVAAGGTAEAPLDPVAPPARDPPVSPSQAGALLAAGEIASPPPW